MTAATLHKLRAHALTLAVTALTLPVAVAQAADVSGDSTGLKETGGASGLPTGTGLSSTIGNMIGAVLSLLGTIFVALTVYAGFLYMTAGGNEEKVKTAKKIMSRAVIGVILIFSAYLISSTVINGITDSIGS